MKTNPRIHRRGNDRSGSILTLGVVMLALFFVAAALALDLAKIQLCETELRAAVDSATRAGAETLARGDSLADAAAEIKAVAAENLVSNSPLVIADADITFGRATIQNNGKFEFAADATPTNALRVRGRRTPGVNGMITPVFGTMFGQSGYAIQRPAAAVIDERDIVLVVDRSSSMGADDGWIHPVTGETLQRIDAVKYSVGLFRNVIEATPSTEALGAARYDNASQIIAKLKTDYSEFDNDIYGLTLGSGTNIGAGIDKGLEALESHRVGATPVMIVLTDGPHDGDRDPVTAAIEARATLPTMKIHAITFSPDADQAQMQLVAQHGGGIHYHADDLNTLSSVFEELARTAGINLIE